jgi:uncharacterized protein (TIGR02996 family)
MLEKDLVAAVRAALDDDQPRLVYADWLLERGDLRGELIQVQCRLASPRPRGKRALRERERELLAQLKEPKPDWASAWPPAYARGFATRVHVRDLQTLHARADEIRRRHPLAEIVLADGSMIALSDDGARWAEWTRRVNGAGITLDNGTTWTTTKIVVRERGGRTLLEEVHTLEVVMSSGGEWESGDEIEAFALSEDGTTLRMKLSGPDAPGWCTRVLEDHP